MRALPKGTELYLDWRDVTPGWEADADFSSRRPCFAQCVTCRPAGCAVPSADFVEQPPVEEQTGRAGRADDMPSDAARMAECGRLIGHIEVPAGETTNLRPEINDALQRAQVARGYIGDIGSRRDDRKGETEVWCTVNGVPFRASALGTSKLAFIRLWQKVIVQCSAAAEAARCSEASLAADSLVTKAVPLEGRVSLQDAVTKLLSARREYAAQVSEAGEEDDAIAAKCRREALQTLVAEFGTMFPQPSALLSLFGHDIQHGMLVSNAAATCFQKREKRVKVGYSLAPFLLKVRRSAASPGGAGKAWLMYCCSNVSSPFVVMLNDMKEFATLEACLEYYSGVRLCHVVDEATFVAPPPGAPKGTAPRPFTCAEVLSALKTGRGRGTRHGMFTALRVVGTLWPPRSLSEVDRTVAMLEEQVRVIMGDRVLREVWHASRKVHPTSGPQQTVVVEVNGTLPNGGDVFSSHVAAMQLLLTWAAYTELVAKCKSHLPQLRRTLRSWIPCEDDISAALDVKCRAWAAHVDELFSDCRSYSGDTRIPDNLAGRRGIGSYVDEYPMQPTGAGRAQALHRAYFYRCLTGSTLEDFNVSEKLSWPEQGLSPVSACQQGAETFGVVEIIGIVLVELLTGLRNATGGLKSYLEAPVGTSMQPLHTDATEPQNCVATIGLNGPSEGAYSATLVATGPFNLDALDDDRRRAVEAVEKGEPWAEVSDCLVEGYRELLSLMPDELLEHMQPAVDSGTWAGRGFLFQLPTLLHCGPGNLTNPDPRKVVFTAMGMKGRHYTGKTQVFWTTVIARLHGELGFLQLLHVVEFSLCSGVHVARHFPDVWCTVGTEREWRQLDGRWTHEIMFRRVVEAVCWLLEPGSSGPADWRVLLGERFYTKKRAPDGQHLFEFCRLSYPRLRVRAAVVRLWEWLAEGNPRRLDAWLEMTGATVRFEGWAGRSALEQLRAAWLLAVTSVRGLEFGFERARSQVDVRVEQSGWDGLCPDIPEGVDQVEVAAGERVSVANTQRHAELLGAGFEIGAAVEYTYQGERHDGIVSCHTPDGKLRCFFNSLLGMADVAPERVSLRSAVARSGASGGGVG